MADNATIITGEDNVRVASLLALRGALKLETKGLKRRGRSARTIANETMGTSHKTAKATYTAFNAYLVEMLGPDFDRPL